MASLGDNVAIIGCSPSALRAFIVSLAGVLFVRWNNQIDPNSIGLDWSINLLLIADRGLYELKARGWARSPSSIINNEINTYS